MKNNTHKKLYSYDKFGFKYYCQHASLNLKRSEKKFGGRKTRRELNKIA